MRGCPDITTLSDGSIPLVSWCVVVYCQRVPNHLNVCPAVDVHMRLGERLTRSRSVNWTNVGRREHGLMAPQISRAKTACRRYKVARPLRLEDRQVELVDGFLVEMRKELEEFLALENGLCFQQVHDGQAEACHSAFVDRGLNV